MLEAGIRLVECDAENDSAWTSAVQRVKRAALALAQQEAERAKDGQP